MTKEEKTARKAELAERRAQREVQLAALKKYWFFLRYDINGRACPQDFFLFFARQLLWLSQKLPLALFAVMDHLRSISITLFILLILCIFLPPVLLCLYMFVLALATGAIWLITAALLTIAGYAPIFFAAVKRRINDVSRTAGASRARVLLFVISAAMILLSLVVCSLSWFGVPAFATGGAVAWMVGLAYVVLPLSFLLLLGQLHYYSFKPGVKGENFAGTNPIEVPLTESSLAESGSHVASRSLQVVSFVLIGLASAISFALANAFVRLVRVPSRFDLASAFVSDFLPYLVYGIQAVAVVAFVFIVCFKGRYKTGDLASSEITSINACFKPRFTEVTDELRNQVAEAEESERRKRKGAIGMFLGMIALAYNLLISPFYYVLVIATVIVVIKSSPIFAVILLGMAFAGAACCNYFRSVVSEESGPSGWIAIITAPVRQLLSFVRGVALWPFSGESKKLSKIARKRYRMRNVAFIDPLGLHQLALGQIEMCGVQLLFCFLIVGIPISWAWSIFDGIRFARMSDDDFLMQYSDYCLSKGVMDKLLGLMNKLSKTVVPVVACVTLMALAMTFGDSGADTSASDSDQDMELSQSAAECVQNMKAIQAALEKAKKAGEEVGCVSDLIDLKYLKEEPQCPSEGEYLIDRNGHVTCSSGEAGHVLKHTASNARTSVEIQDTYDQAKKAFNSENWTKAIQLFTLFVEKNPSSPHAVDAMQYLAICNGKVGDVAEQEKWLRAFATSTKKVGARTSAQLNLALMQQKRGFAAFEAAAETNDVEVASALRKDAFRDVSGSIRDFRAVADTLTKALEADGKSLDAKESEQYHLYREQAIYLEGVSWHHLSWPDAKVPVFRAQAAKAYEKCIAAYPDGKYARRAQDAYKRLQREQVVTKATPMAALRDANNIGKKTRGGAVDGDATTERAVMMALRWLKATQSPDGSWGMNPELGLMKGMHRAAGAGFAVLTFLAHGETPASKEFGRTVERAILYLVNDVYVVKDKAGNEEKDPNGLTPYVKMRGAGGSEYGFLIGTYALCEAYAMTGDPNVKAAAEKTLARIISGQTATGGWNYNMARTLEFGAPDDISYGGWALQALKAGKMAGIHLPGMDECIKKAVKCLKTRNYSEKAGFVYRATTNHKGGGGGLAGVGCLAMQLLGYAKEPEVANALNVMKDWQPSLDKEYSYVSGLRNNPQYYCYYATQCKYQAGMAGNVTPAKLKLWKKWNAEMKALYPKSIVKVLKKDGSPYTVKDATGKDCEIGHWVNQDHYNYDVMGTCLAALQLMVYYRYLPTTQLKVVGVEKAAEFPIKDNSDKINVEVGI